MLKHSKKESAEKSEAFKFVLFLNDAKGKTVSRGGDAKQIDVRVQVARIDQQRYDAALPASSVEGLVDNGNGSYSFTVAPGQFCEAYVVVRLDVNFSIFVFREGV